MQTQHQQQADDLPLYLAIGGAAIAWILAVSYFAFWTITLTAAIAAAVRAVLWLRR